jgi:hypothetical protein
VVVYCRNIRAKDFVDRLFKGKISDWVRFYQKHWQLGLNGNLLLDYESFYNFQLVSVESTSVYES